MNSELEAIMRRRRRKADGLPGSPGPGAVKAKSDSSRRATSGEGPPMPMPLLPTLPPPPPSSSPPSSSSIRRSKRMTTMRPRASPSPPRDTISATNPMPPPPPPPPRDTKVDTSTRRRALDQIRGTRSAFQVDNQGTTNDSIITQASANQETTQDVDDSMTTQVDTTMIEQTPNDSMIVQLSNDTMTSVDTSMQEVAVGYSPTLDRQMDAIGRKLDRAIDGIEYSLTTPSGQDSSVESPQKASDENLQEKKDYSSSEEEGEDEENEEEEEEPETEEEKPHYGSPVAEPSFAVHFEADFGSSSFFGEGVASLETDYEPPPLFEAFEPAETIDYSPIPDPPMRDKPQISLRTVQVISGDYQCPPITNPLTGNIIVCRMEGKEIGIYEVELATFSTVEFTPILTLDVQRKFKSVYGTSAFDVNKVLSMTAGVTRSQGQARVRVAALVEFHTLNQVGKRLIRTALLVWQWRYASKKSVALQSLLSPPNKTSATYNHDSLRMADGLVFLFGTAKGKGKGACVFCVKPYANSVWSANLVPGTGKISSIAVTSQPSRKFKYIAIAQTSGSLSVWSYGESVDHKSLDAPKGFAPIAHLESASAVSSVTETIVVGDDDTPKSDDSGYCTNLEWISPSSSSSSMLLLAAAFTNGMAIYHVSLPLLLQKGDSGVGRAIPDPTASPSLKKTALLAPFCAARWALQTKRASVSWLESGPHTSPCLSFLLERDSATGVVLGSVDIPLYGDTDSIKSSPYPFNVISRTVLPASADGDSVGLLSSRSVKAIVLYRNGSVMTLTPTLLARGSYFPWTRSLAASLSPGLDSAGYVSLPDTTSDSDGILQVFTVQQCQRELSALPCSDANMDQLDWTGPKLRHLLCRSFIGDTRDAQEPSREAQSASNFGGENITAGSNIEMICDLIIGSGLVPHRIVRCKGTELCAVLFCRDVGHKDGLSTDAVSFALIDTSKKEIINILDGRDVAFLPNSKPGREEALILSADGSFIQMCCRAPQSENVKESTWEECNRYRSLLGVEADEDYVECRRLALLSSGPKLALLLVGTRVRDERSCLVIGEFVNIDEPYIDAWKCLLPSMKTSAVCWLGPNETIESLIDLPSYQDGRRLIAAATGARVILLSPSLRSLAEVSTALSSPSLTPMGSHTVAYCSLDYKIRYLCSLDGKFSTGLLATLPVPRFGHAEYHLMAVRPDRFVYSQCHCGVRLVERDESADTFLLHTASTRPALLLEPMVANAICETGGPGESTSLLRSVIERFGRKVAPFPHGDDEGIGSLASGLTPAVFELLSAHGLKDPASWLLTGICCFERAANSKVLPPWIPVHSKAAAAFNRDAYLHIISNGDQYFSDYVKSPDHNMASTLPRPSDPSAVVCHEFARQAVRDGDVAGALKLLDVAGTSSSDSALLHLALSLQLDQSTDVTKVLKALSGYGVDGSARIASHSTTSSSLAALAIDLKSRQVKGKMPLDGGEFEKTSDEFRRRWMTQLAPSIQRGRKLQRARHRLIGEDAIGRATRGTDKAVHPDSRWLTPCNESKHIWSEGPFKDKENLLLLDRMEEWLGRKRPAILGKEGAAAALERGEKTLADILNRANHYDDDSFGEEIGGGDGPGTGATKDGWIEGIGEGRTDEDNLSLYLRMSEGADEDSAWRADGLADLTQYANKAVPMGQIDCFTLQPTTSSVDEGESGKVKLLYDLVFEDPKDSEGPAGLLVEAARGSSLDVGMLHGETNDMRRKCSLEFWYHLPLEGSVTDEIVLARRSVSTPGVDFARLCVAGDKDGFLWELVLLPSGKLEFRSSGGTSLLSTSGVSSEFEPNPSMGDFGDAIQQTEDDGGLVSWERPDGGGGWNHICLVFSSQRRQSLTDCSVTIFMKGVKVASTVASIVPPGLEGNELTDTVVIDDIMKKTVYLFGLNAVANFRLTELRLWSCERNEDDIKFMMYESLQAAETKKKLKVKIRNKRGDDTAGGRHSAGSLLSPPKDGRGMKGLLPPPRKRLDVGTSTVASEDKNFAFDASFSTFGGPRRATNGKDEENVGSTSGTLPQPKEPQPYQSVSAQRSEAFQSDTMRLQNLLSNMPDDSYELELESKISKPPAADNADFRDFTPAVPSHLIRLSSEVRSSAASALIRGPPATRHFGGNRGGLSRSASADRDLTKRFGVGAIAICGAEKTVVYDHDQTPPGKTYPIGASGAVISDEMDNGEYLCCFLAKDKRMVVFELLTRTVVVELQMTTKLNFWRYLPPQAHGHTLVFLLITPVGGFHWLPLDESPRPRQVWKRGPALQGKKIVTYEEGGSNGFHGPEALSAVALLLVSMASTGTPIEAWIVQVGGELPALCVSSDVMGAALFRPFHIDDETFLPHLVTATRVESEIVIKVEPLVQNPLTGELAVADVSIGAIIDQSQVRSLSFTPPALAMGGLPEVLCCCCEGIVIACVRRKGLVVAYHCEDELVLIRQEHVENYIVDGALRPGEGEAAVELVLLLSDSENLRDGFVKSISISR